MRKFLLNPVCTDFLIVGMNDVGFLSRVIIVNLRAASCIDSNATDEDWE